jgi:hypothetical protein
MSSAYIAGQVLHARPSSNQKTKSIADVIAPFLVELLNNFMQAGQGLKMFKMAYVTPLLKKLGLNPSATSSNRLISSLSVISK